MAKKISIQSAPEEITKNTVASAQDKGSLQILGDMVDNKLADSWKDLEMVISEIFNSRVMAKIYLYVVRYPGKSLDELSEKLEYRREQISKYANKLSILGYISGDKKKDNKTVFFAQPPEMVIKKFARTVEQKMEVLANIDTILLKKTKDLALYPWKAIVGDDSKG